MNYIPPLYRPPSEAKSLIIQVTSGCSHNACGFCSMYKGKPFKVIDLEGIFEMLEKEKHNSDYYTKVFLADGDALVLPTDHLLKLLHYIKMNFKKVTRVSTYATPKDILRKSHEDLLALKEAGLTMAYMGIESGCDDLLKQMSKGASAKEITEAGQKLKKAGWTLSVTAISGLGGAEFSKEHALDTAKVVREINPDYFSLLSLMVEKGTPLFEWIQKGDFTELSCKDILEETYEMIAHLEGTKTVFRNNHASNFFAFNGTLPDDKNQILSEIQSILEDDSFIEWIENTKGRSL